MRISGWSSDVCSSDLLTIAGRALIKWLQTKACKNRKKAEKSCSLTANQLQPQDTANITGPGSICASIFYSHPQACRKNRADCVLCPGLAVSGSTLLGFSQR